MSNPVSILFYVVAGFFFYTVNVLGFVSEAPRTTKWGIMLAFIVPAVGSLSIGLAINSFRNWKRDVGIVLLSTAGLMSFLVFSFVCFLKSEEFKKMMKPDTLAFFNDYVTGALCLSISAIVGLLLLKKKKPPAN
jgi:glucan phosphoethanolaminetransferase (alkaline phosphatase superfamily)